MNSWNFLAHNQVKNARLILVQYKFHIAPIIKIVNLYLKTKNFEVLSTLIEILLFDLSKSYVTIF